MYTVTFYSFKGGSGRSMALANVAVELAKNGQRVLIADMDLEAPGLDTFNLPRPSTQPGGLVDYVHKYLDKGETPDLADFVYESRIPGVSGKLWVMPAGRNDTSYDASFRTINWGDLYENRDGFYLFEDLKGQWKDHLNPDYVLIDSRTGHTDIGGICTRQLPDAVVLFFFPNEQNRRGLHTMVQQIRAEESDARPYLHYVMSNVPELDDEENILATNLHRIQDALGFSELSAVIHHYDSMALLTQVVFTLERPKTRLAEEYRNLTRTIRRHNSGDREAALEFLQEIAPRVRYRVGSPVAIEQRIKDIRSQHSDDAEVLSRLATFMRRRRRFDEALSLLDQAFELGTPPAELRLMRAELNNITKHFDQAREDLTALFSARDATYVELSAAARLLGQLDAAALGELPFSSAFHGLDAEGQFFLASDLTSRRHTLPVAEFIYRSLISNPKLPQELQIANKNGLVITLIGEGKFEEALGFLALDRTRTAALDIADLFNFAMAEYALNGQLSKDSFECVIEKDRESRVQGANGHQCLAIALWVCGLTEDALNRIGQSSQDAMTSSEPLFSAWSYLQVTPQKFLEDLRELQDAVQGGNTVPRFIRETSGWSRS